MTPRRSSRAAPTAAQRAEWAAAREAKLTELQQRLVDEVGKLTDGQQWRAWLEFATNFHHYSFNNTVLIFAQRPEATWVAGVRSWNELGRHVRKGEKGIAILAPITGRRAEPTGPDDGPEPPAPTAALEPAAGGEPVTAAQQAALTTGKIPEEIVRATGQRVIATALAFTEATDAALGQVTPAPTVALGQRVHAGVQRTVELHQRVTASPTDPQPTPAPRPAPADQGALFELPATTARGRSRAAAGAFAPLRQVQPGTGQPATPPASGAVRHTGRRR